MTSWTQPLPYFPLREIACKCCGVIKVDVRFAAMLPALRQAWGRPLTPISLCRCPKHNASIKDAHPTSLHLTQNPKWPTGGAAAVDIAWRDWSMVTKLTFARLAHSRGFRIGLHDGFCHLDLGRELGISPKPFIYGTWSGSFSVEDVL
jgi:hypothetical protein